MIRPSAQPYRLKRKDFDYVPSFHPRLFAGTHTLEQELLDQTGSPQFPNEYLTDFSGWLPNQDADNLPFACTSYATTKLARILGVLTATVAQIEALTNSNAKGGYGVVAAIDTARRVLGWFKWRYIIQATGPLDYFDAHRLAQVSGLPEKRAISAGTPWCPSWEQMALAGVKIMPMPLPAELSSIQKNINAFSWHNYILDGWSQNFAVAPGKLLYRLASWQGPSIDYLYLDRATFNVIMNLSGTVSVTGTNFDVLPAHVPLPDWFWSLWHSWLGFSY